MLNGFPVRGTKRKSLTRPSRLSIRLGKSRSMEFWVFFLINFGQRARSVDTQSSGVIMSEMSNPPTATAQARIFAGSLELHIPVKD
jgi:hypothetical protein